MSEPAKLDWIESTGGRRDCRHGSERRCSILDTIDVPLVVVGRDCKVARFNRAAAETLGATRIGHRSPDRRYASAGRVPDIRATVHASDGRWSAVPPGDAHGDRWFLFALRRTCGNRCQVRGAVLTFTNFTAFRASLGQAIYEREYTKTILNAVIDPLVVLDDAPAGTDGQSRLL